MRPRRPWPSKSNEYPTKSLAPLTIPRGPRVTLLSTRGLTWRVGEVSIVDDVTLDLAPGEFLAVIGPNGAGKNSLFNLISGLRRPSAGTVTLDGTDVTRLTPYRRTPRLQLHACPRSAPVLLQ